MIKSSSSAPVVSCESWAVADLRSGSVIGGQNSLNHREIASITKIMTCLLVVKYIEDTGFDLENFIPISHTASSIGGTSARLRAGEQIQTIDLLYGLMLPSGNDAAVALSEFFGSLLAYEYGDEYADGTRYFVREMNLIAKEIGLVDTHFANPHGMSKPKNLSSARDVCRLAAVAMHNELFRGIVSTCSYTCYVLQSDGCGFRRCKWENTNELLGNGFCGVKTGVTKNAGPCLCACYCKNGKSVIVVVLGSASKEQRWIDVPKLAEWGILQLTKKIK